jgi:hypothetical protein
MCAARQSGADKTLQNNDGKLAADIAREHEHARLQMLLGG